MRGRTEGKRTSEAKQADDDAFFDEGLTPGEKTVRKKDDTQRLYREGRIERGGEDSRIRELDLASSELDAFQGREVRPVDRRGYELVDS